MIDSPTLRMYRAKYPAGAGAVVDPGADLIPSEEVRTGLMEVRQLANDARQDEAELERAREALASATESRAIAAAAIKRGRGDAKELAAADKQLTQAEQRVRQAERDLDAAQRAVQDAHTEFIALLDRAATEMIDTLDQQIADDQEVALTACARAADALARAAARERVKLWARNPNSAGRPVPSRAQSLLADVRTHLEDQRIGRSTRAADIASGARTPGGTLRVREVGDR